jgi:endonuclease/exonuclease/phosphatase (EEP) superfamily protein YafD
MRLVNLHLETPRKGLERLFHSETAPLAVNTELRRIQSRQIASWVDALGPSLVIAGDFNTPVESPIYREGWGGYRNAFSRTGFGFGMTRYNGWIRVRIDHVLARGEWRAIRARVGPDVSSDHRPVVAEVVRDGSGG